MSESADYTFESDVDYLAKLRQLVASGSVRIRFDAKKLREMDSPVAVIAETERWAMGMVVLCGGLWWFLGIWAAAACLAVCILAYAFWGRHGIARNIERRIHQKALEDIAIWRRLWRYGGVSLEPGDGRTETCVAPNGSWIQFTEAFMRRSDQ